MGTHRTAALLRKIASRYPEIELGVACEGTAVESTTFKVNARAFLFLRNIDARFKLGASVAELARLAAKDPARYHVGAGGWAKLSFPDDQAPPAATLERWVDESYRAMAGTPAPARAKPKGRAASAARSKSSSRKR